MIDTIMGQADLKNNTIEFKPQLPEINIEIDKTRVQQIILNFLSNAVKFSPPNEVIRVFLKTDKINDNTTTVTIQVIDYGVGISAEEQDNNFDENFNTTNMRAK